MENIALPAPTFIANTSLGLPETLKLDQFVEERNNDVGQTLAEAVGAEYLDRVTAQDYHLHPGVFFLPDKTIAIPRAQAARYPWIDDRRFLGGYVPDEVGYAVNKVVSHPLAHPEAVSPPNWDRRAMDHISQATAAGYSVFCEADARMAIQQLHDQGHQAIRIKVASGESGEHQGVQEYEDDIIRWIKQEVTEEQWRRFGIVLEQNLQNVRTWSIGNWRIGDHEVSSLALQYSTRNNFPTNNIEYGGSEGIAILGGLDRLAQIPFADEPLIPEIIAKAKIYREGFRRIDGPQETRGNWDGMIGEDEQRAPVAVIAENGLRIGGLTPLLAHSLLYMNQQRQQNQPVVAIAGYTAHEFGDTLSQIRDGDYIRHTTSFVGEDVNYGPMRVRVGLTAAYDQLDQVALPKSRPEPYQVAMV